MIRWHNLSATVQLASGRSILHVLVGGVEVVNCDTTVYRANCKTAYILENAHSAKLVLQRALDLVDLRASAHVKNMDLVGGGDGHTSVSFQVHCVHTLVKVKSTRWSWASSVPASDGTVPEIGR